MSSMDLRRKVLSLFKRRREKEESVLFLQNGSLLLEKFIAASNGKYDIPIRTFTAEDLKRATKNFVNRFYSSRLGYICRGSWEGRTILVKKFHDSSRVPPDATYDTLSGAINDIVTTAQMSHHKNVLKLLGCCLEFKPPALVYEYAEGEFLLDLLLKGNSNVSLSWRSRLKIANDIANAILYLHTAFRTPIIYRILNPTNIIIDQCGTAKLFNFSFSISLPPGKLQVQDDVIGVTGYLDCEYFSSGIVSQKTDVYSYGVLLLVLLMGQGAIIRDQEREEEHIVYYVKDCMSRNEWNHIVDPLITRGDTVFQQQQFQAFLDLALSCTQEKGTHRPDMTDVAKELVEITRRFQDCWLNVN